MAKDDHDHEDFLPYDEDGKLTEPVHCTKCGVELMFDGEWLHWETREYLERKQKSYDEWVEWCRHAQGERNHDG